MLHLVLEHIKSRENDNSGKCLQYIQIDQSDYQTIEYNWFGRGLKIGKLHE